MNMSKYLLLSVICGAISGLQAKELVDVKTETPVVVHVPEQVAQEPVISEQMQGQDVDIAEWAKGLDLSDEEKAQFVAEMSRDMDQEVVETSDNSKKIEDKDLLVNNKPIVGAEQEQVLLESKVVPADAELPEATK